MLGRWLITFLCRDSRILLCLALTLCSLLLSEGEYQNTLPSCLAEHRGSWGAVHEMSPSATPMACSTNVISERFPYEGDVMSVLDLEASVSAAVAMYVITKTLISGKEPLAS